MANSFKVESFNSTKVLAYVAIGLFSTILLFNGLYIVWGLSNFIFPNWQFDGNELMAFFTALISSIELLDALVTLIAIVVFLIWLYKAFSNLSSLKARDLEFSPGWAVGWWFIPLANLFKPYQVVTELWRESDPEFDENLGFLSSVVSNPTFFGVWWTFWILSNLLANIVNGLGNSIAASTSTDNATLNVFFITVIISSTFTIVAGGLLIYIIQSVNVRQQKRFERIENTMNKLSPEPPVFNQ